MSKKNRVYRVSLTIHPSGWIVGIARTDQSRMYHTTLRRARQLADLVTPMLKSRNWRAFFYANGWTMYNWKVYKTDTRGGQSC